MESLKLSTINVTSVSILASLALDINTKHSFLHNASREI
jgi:hypothetical protein